MSEPKLQRVYVWELPVRTAHWLIFLSIVVLSATGYFMGNPVSVASGEARLHFFTGTVKVVHFYAAIVFTLALLSRFLWMFLGNSFSRWDQFVPWSRERRRGILDMHLYYLFLRDRPTPGEGHNPLAGFTYIFVYGVLLIMALTGLGLYGQAAHVGSPLRWFGFLADVFGGPQYARWLHHGFMWFVWGFFAHHVMSAILFSLKEGTGTMESIVSGYRFVRAEDVAASEEGKGP
ncbi:MAG TPA: Ni/Fe-hydrogenase, b-type cytochrome subunit [Anaeromyxobacteraceae bacterium]|nr:Ni/Fe-hydrogenase, b-type cytochrome subunit [Anaeromyxobacteraceae bacterium]